MYFSGDRTISILVKEGEGFLELGDLFFVELVGHRKSINLKYDNATLLLTDFHNRITSKYLREFPQLVPI